MDTTAARRGCLSIRKFSSVNWDVKIWSTSPTTQGAGMRRGLKDILDMLQRFFCLTILNGYFFIVEQFSLLNW